MSISSPSPTVCSPAAATAWHGTAQLRFTASPDGHTTHQGAASSPLKLQRAFRHADGRCELPLLHTAGGLVGGDQLSVALDLEAGSRALLTSVAAQKVYGTVGRSRRMPEGSWAVQELHGAVAEGADLEWLPQELVLYADGLFEQRAEITLAPGASYLGAEVVRLGRSAAGETLQAGCWRSSLGIRRLLADGPRWELVDRLAIGGEGLQGQHGMAGHAVFGSLVWAAPEPLTSDALETLLAACRSARQGLDGDMACGALEQGLVARYRGPSSQAARHWFTRIWALVRQQRGLPPPELPRVWPFQEQPFAAT